MGRQANNRQRTTPQAAIAGYLATANLTRHTLLRSPRRTRAVQEQAGGDWDGRTAEPRAGKQAKIDAAPEFTSGNGRRRIRQVARLGPACARNQGTRSRRFQADNSDKPERLPVAPMNLQDNR